MATDSNDLQGTSSELVSVDSGQLLHKSCTRELRSEASAVESVLSLELAEGRLAKRDVSVVALEAKGKRKRLKYEGASESFWYQGKRGSIRRRGPWWYARYSCFGKKYEKHLRTSDHAEAIARLRELLKQVRADEESRELDGPAPVHELSTSITASNIGAVSEMLVTIDLMNKGIPVFRAVGPNCPCDLVAIFGNRCFQIEVKVGTISSRGKVKVGAMRPTCQYDVLAIVNRQQGITYIPSLDLLQEM